MLKKNVYGMVNNDFYTIKLNNKNKNNKNKNQAKI
jgi:hypothetical protein